MAQLTANMSKQVALLPSSMTYHHDDLARLSVNSQATKSFWSQYDRLNWFDDFANNGKDVPITKNSMVCTLEEFHAQSLTSSVYSLPQYNLFGSPEKFQFARFPASQDDVSVSMRTFFSDCSVLTVGFGRFGSVSGNVSRRDSFSGHSQSDIECFYDSIDSLPIESSPSSSPPKKGKRKLTSQDGCVFCKNNKETKEVYEGHVLKYPDGKVACPVLRKYNCRICNNGGGDYAHTDKYCPLNQDGHVPSVMNLLKNARSSNGKKRGRK